jgi:hypothetical protein
MLHTFTYAGTFNTRRNGNEHTEQFSYDVLITADRLNHKNEVVDKSQIQPLFDRFSQGEWKAHDIRNFAAGGVWLMHRLTGGRDDRESRATKIVCRVAENKPDSRLLIAVWTRGMELPQDLPERTDLPPKAPGTTRVTITAAKAIEVLTSGTRAKRKRGSKPGFLIPCRASVGLR